MEKHLQRGDLMRSARPKVGDLAFPRIRLNPCATQLLGNRVKVAIIEQLAFQNLVMMLSVNQFENLVASWGCDL